MPCDSAGTRDVHLDIMKEYLCDARRNLAAARDHVAASRWKAAAMACSISFRLLLDLQEELDDDRLILTRQRNALVRGASEVIKNLWLIGHEIRRSGCSCEEVSRMLKVFLVCSHDHQGRLAMEA